MKLNRISRSLCIIIIHFIIHIILSCKYLKTAPGDILDCFAEYRCSLWAIHVITLTGYNPQGALNNDSSESRVILLLDHSPLSLHQTKLVTHHMYGVRCVWLFLSLYYDVIRLDSRKSVMSLEDASAPIINPLLSSIYSLRSI